MKDEQNRSHNGGGVVYLLQSDLSTSTIYCKVRYPLQPGSMSESIPSGLVKFTFYFMCSNDTIIIFFQT